MVGHVLREERDDGLGLALAVVHHYPGLALVACWNEQLDGRHTLDRIPVVGMAARHCRVSFCVHGPDVYLSPHPRGACGVWDRGRGMRIRSGPESSQKCTKEVERTMCFKLAATFSHSGVSNWQ